MKNILLLTMTVIIFLAGAVFASQASAQYQPGSDQGQFERMQGQHQGMPGQFRGMTGHTGMTGPFQGMPGQFRGMSGQFRGMSTPINGTTYTNANFGVQVSIPSGWSGIEMKRGAGATTVTLAPGGFHPIQGGQRPPVTISLSMIPKGSAPHAPSFVQRNYQDGAACTNSTTAKTVNSLNFNEVITQCTFGNMTMKSQSDITQTSSSYVTLGLRGDSNTNFDSQSTIFQTMLGTLQITTPSTMPQSSTTTPSGNTTASSTVIPTWIKKNAGYWSKGNLGNSDFVSGVQYLIHQGIMRIPPLPASGTNSTSTSTTNSTTGSIPTWIKTNAGYWSSGQITDNDFVKGIQYLISSRIMKVS